MRCGRLRLRFRTHDEHSRGVPLPAMTPRQRLVAETVIFAFRDGTWEPSRMAARAVHDLGLEPAQPWIDQLAVDARAIYAEAPAETPGDLLRLVAAILVDSTKIDPTVRDLLLEDPGWHGPRHTAPTEMGERRWPVEPLSTPAEVARFLTLDSGTLEWYADVKSLERSVVEENLRHYDYRWRRKRRGGARLIEAPKQNLKYFQRRILRSVLDHVPAHDAAHGFRRGRSIQSHATPHTGRAVVVRLDLDNFFTAVSAGRVFSIFRAAGYPIEVARLLVGLTTNATPHAVLVARPGQERAPSDAALRGPHLPQGAPTSPALANLAAFGLDRRLDALTSRFDARYTRYADDLAISGGDDFGRSIPQFLALVGTIAKDEGFRINRAKTQIRGRHQRQVLTGMVVNNHLNVHRNDFDQLRAVLHDASTNGPAAANRGNHPQFRAHLEGRIGFVQATNPVRARKLWMMFDRIDW